MCEEGEIPYRYGVYASGANFTASSTVDIYVTSNKNWGTLRQPIGSDMGDGVNANVPTDSAGSFSCTQIWASASTVGTYDVVVDNNQDGTFDTGVDAVDGESNNPSFRVF